MMTDFIAVLEEMRGRTEYDYVAEMAHDTEKWIRQELPILTGGLEERQISTEYANDAVYGRLCMGSEYKRFGLGCRFNVAQWQYKDMVKRAGADALETACRALGIPRSTVVNAIFANDWRSLDELMRYHYLDKAVALAIDNIWTGVDRK